MPPPPAQVFGVDLDLGQQCRDRAVMAQGVLELLLYEIADHAVGFRPQHIQREHLIGFVGGTLKCQQADLRPVAMSDNQLVAGLDDLCQRCGRGGDVGALGLRGQRFATAQKGISPEGCNDKHGLVSQRGDEDCLDGVEPVLGLVEDDGGRAFEHLLGDFHRRDVELAGDFGTKLGLGIVERR